jgi:hypothetical protein
VADQLNASPTPDSPDEKQICFLVRLGIFVLIFNAKKATNAVLKTGFYQ